MTAVTCLRSEMRRYNMAAKMAAATSMLFRGNEEQIEKLKTGFFLVIFLYEN